MKGKDEVISEFNELVNMTAEDLESWLKSGDSNSVGWPKDDAGDGAGETVGHDSGRKIVGILKDNPEKKPGKYTDEQISHMRKVVSYCKRHIAQEKSVNRKKPDEEVKQTKSYASLKNWGHDFLKAQRRGENGDAGGDEEEGEDGEGEEDEEDEEEEAGDKRKKSGGQEGSAKRRETRQGKGLSTKNAEENGGEEEDEEYKDENDEDDVDEDEVHDEDEDESNPVKGPKKGETVSWNWGRGNPEGKVLDVKGDTTTITTKRGNRVSRHGNPEDPAVVLETGTSKAIKLDHELK